MYMKLINKIYIKLLKVCIYCVRIKLNNLKLRVSGMDENTTKLYYMWLGTACNFEPDLIDLCYSSQIYSEDIHTSDVYKTDKQIKRVFENRNELQNKLDRSQYKGRINLNVSLAEAEKILKDCEKQNINIITIGSKHYPDRLRNIYCPPRFLFVKGDITGVDDVLGISIVGTRTATPSGITTAEKISYELSEKGVIITSGMAVGIDAAAHRGAISSGGRTFAVLAGGVDIVYPAVNRDIYEMICETGAIISERPPHCIGQPRFYKERNRIITGLSLGVLFVEGAESSGTSISSRLAFENDRDIFAVPNDINIVQSQLPNRLITEGAVLVRNSEDILNQYTYIYPSLASNNASIKNKIKDIFGKMRTAKKPKNVQKNKSKSNPVHNEQSNTGKNENDKTDLINQFYESEKFKSLSDDDKNIVKYIATCGENGVIADDITENLGISANELNSKLMILQINQVLTQRGGGRLFLKL